MNIKIYIRKMLRVILYFSYVCEFQVCSLLEDFSDECA